MTTQLLIYRSAVPVNQAIHADCSVETGTNYAFSAGVNSVPLMAVEFPQAANELAIVFGGSGTEITPAAILGLRDGENLLLERDGSWRGTYIPAFLRRYPFVFSRAEAERFVLCIDETWPGFNREGRGERLFGADGSVAPYLENIVNFLREYQLQFVNTQRFCARVLALGLLEPMQAQVTVDGGTQLSLGGFMAVSRDRLKALPGETLAELAKTDDLELIYLHLHSLRHFDALRGRLGGVG